MTWIFRLDELFDVVTNGFRSNFIAPAPLLAQARDRELDTVDGLEMLVGQAALAYVVAMPLKLVVRGESASCFVEIDFCDPPWAIERHPVEIEEDGLSRLNRLEIRDGVALENARAAEQIKLLRLATGLTVDMQRGVELSRRQIDAVDFPMLLLSRMEREIILDPEATTKLPLGCPAVVGGLRQWRLVVGVGQVKQPVEVRA